MSTDCETDAGGLSAAPTVKVHVKMCSDLQNMVDIVSEIIPEIEAARPRASGMEALCLLNKGIDRAKHLLQRCRESSILYLVFTGETFLSRCKMSRNLIEHCLCQIQNTVPLASVAKISQIILVVRNVVFCLDTPEQEAGKLLRELIHTYVGGLTEEMALSAIHAVCSCLQIASPRALMIEIRSIKKLINSFGEGERGKRKILLFFQKLVSKYIKAPNKGQLRGSPLFERPHSSSSEEQLRNGEDQIDPFSRPVPPKEFQCPLSARLMRDPVIIASGQTFERVWIQKWFDEGHDTCPQTKTKLDNLSFFSNTILKDLILNWCRRHHLSPPDPEAQGDSVRSWDAVSLNSIGGFSSCIENLSLH